MNASSQDRPEARLSNTSRAVQKKIRMPRYRRKFYHRTRPGTAPGTLVSDQSQLPTQVRIMLYGAGNVIEKPLQSLAEIPDPAPGQILWLDVTGLADAEIIESIGKRFHLHPLALEDVVHIHQRAKAEQYDEHLFIVVRMLHDAPAIETEQVSIFLGSNFVITFQENPGDCFEVIRTRIRQNGRIQSRSADYLAYSLIDAVIDAYFPQLEKIGGELDAIDEIITCEGRQNCSNRLHEIRRELNQLRKIFWQHRDAISSLLRQENQLISPETQIYLRDCHDHIIQLMDVSETDRESCIGLQELYLAELSQRTNDVMKVLTLFATLFLPLSFIAGVYGMNFNPQVSPWNMPELNWYFGYPACLGLMLGIALGMGIFFWRRGWFHGRDR